MGSVTKNKGNETLVTGTTVVCEGSGFSISGRSRGYNHAILRRRDMRPFLYIVGGFVFLGGLVFFLQGINILPGRIMTGDLQWSINGAIMIAVALGLFFLANRRK